MSQTQKANIDAIEPSKSLIDLSNAHEDSLDSTLIGYALESLEDDIVLINLLIDLKLVKKLFVTV